MRRTRDDVYRDDKIELLEKELAQERLRNAGLITANRSLAESIREEVAPAQADRDVWKVRAGDADVWKARAKAHSIAADVWEGRARDLAGRIAVKDDHLGNIARSDNLKRLAKDVARESEDWGDE